MYQQDQDLAEVMVAMEEATTTATIVTVTEMAPTVITTKTLLELMARVEVMAVVEVEAVAEMPPAHQS